MTVRLVQLDAPGRPVALDPLLEGGVLQLWDAPTGAKPLRAGPEPQGTNPPRLILTEVRRLHQAPLDGEMDITDMRGTTMTEYPYEGASAASTAPPTFTPVNATPPTGTTSGSTTQTGGAEAVKDEAGHVADRASDSAQEVAGVAAERASDVAQTAKEQVKDTAAEAMEQARGLYEQGRQQVTEQAGVQQQRLAGGMRSVSSELSSMAQSSEDPGLATAVARQLADSLGQAGDWLEKREPAQVLQEVSQYARKHPVTFMAIAAGLGLLAGRVARSAKDSAGDASTADTATGSISTGQHSAGTPLHTAEATSGFAQEDPLTARPGVLGEASAGTAPAGGHLGDRS